MVTIWVLLVVPLLLVSLVLMVVAFPRAVGDGLGERGGPGATCCPGPGPTGEPAEVAVRLLSIAALALPVLAMAYLLARLLRRTVSSVRRSTAGHPARRAVAALAAVAMLGGLAWAWWPGDSYRPIRPNERGTVFDAVPASLASRLALPRTAPVPAPPRLEEGDTGTAQTLWVGDQPPPPKDQPQLSLVLVPADPEPEPAQAAAAGPAATEAAPTWVFPFNRPEPPGDGDNQALAVNTTDGSIRYDVAFALVWADDGSVLNTNEAYALARCSGCASVAIAFQVVLVLGQANVVVPQNLAAAVNYACVQCITYALAQQLVLTLDGPLSEAGMSAIEAIWAQIQQFGQTIDQVPLSQIQATLAGYEQQIVDIVEAESAGQTPTPSPATSSGPPTGTATATESAEPTASDGATPTPEPAESTAGTATPSPDPTTAPATGEATAAAVGSTP